MLLLTFLCHLLGNHSWSFTRLWTHSHLEDSGGEAASSAPRRRPGRAATPREAPGPTGRGRAARSLPCAPSPAGDSGSTGRSPGCREAPGFCTGVAEVAEASVSPKQGLERGGLIVGCPCPGASCSQGRGSAYLQLSILPGVINLSLS